MGRFPRQETTEQRRPFAKRATTGNELADEVAAASSIDAASRASDPSGNRAGANHPVRRRARAPHRPARSWSDPDAGRSCFRTLWFVCLPDRARESRRCLPRTSGPHRQRRRARSQCPRIPRRLDPARRRTSGAAGAAADGYLADARVGARKCRCPNAGDQRAWDAMIIGKASDRGLGSSRLGSRPRHDPETPRRCSGVSHSSVAMEASTTCCS